MDRLPAELLYTVLELAAPSWSPFSLRDPLLDRDRRRWLCGCALVSRRFRQPAQELLWQALRWTAASDPFEALPPWLPDNASPDVFNRLKMSTRQLSFDIKGWNFQNEATAVLSAALNRIPRVRELQLYMDSSFVLDLGDLMAWHGASCLLQQLAQLPADELVKGLHRLYLGPGVDMPSLPSSPLIFVNLTVLSVQCSGIDEDNMYTLLSPAVTPSLRVLSLGYLTTADRRQMLRWMQPPTPDLLTRLDLVSLGIVDRLLPVLEQPACGAQGPTIVHHCGLTGTWGLVPATAHHLTHRRDISHVAVFVPHGTSDEESALRGWTRDEELRSWAKVFDTALVAAEYADGLRWLFLPRHLQPAEEGREDEEETDEVYRELRDATLAAVARRDGQAEVVWLEADTEEEGTLEIWDWVKGKKAEERISRGEERKEGA